MYYFTNNIEPLYSTKIIHKNNEPYLELTFEMFGILENLSYNIEYDDDKEKIIIEIKGKSKEINILESKESIIKELGNLKYTDFDFQVQIDKYIENKYEIYIKLDEKKIEKEEDVENGIYSWLFPIQLYTI
jgi:hypothetical protein